MKALALVVALLSVPAFAADYTPWPWQEPAPNTASGWSWRNKVTAAASAAQRDSPVGTLASAPRASARVRRGARASAPVCNVVDFTVVAGRRRVSFEPPHSCQLAGASAIRPSASRPEPESAPIWCKAASATNATGTNGSAGADQIDVAGPSSARFV